MLRLLLTLDRVISLIKRVPTWWSWLAPAISIVALNLAINNIARKDRVAGILSRHPTMATAFGVLVAFIYVIYLVVVFVLDRWILRAAARVARSALLTSDRIDFKYAISRPTLTECESALLPLLTKYQIVNSVEIARVMVTTARRSLSQ